MALIFYFKYGKMGKVAGGGFFIITFNERS